ncbi:MAG: MalY/PatB family protein [Clostridia bacterium]
MKPTNEYWKLCCKSDAPNGGNPPALISGRAEKETKRLRYDFDQIIDRTHTNSSKWDNVGARLGNANAIPMWLADADFVSPEPVKKMLEERVRHGIYGYPYRTDDFQAATKRWILKQHHIELQENWMVFTTGVVPIIYTAIEAFTEAGDEIIIQQPVYHPFIHAIQDQNRIISNNALLYVDGRYTIDFDDLARRAASKKAKLMVFCNPHNPVGRCWSREEVDRVSQICLDNQVLLISDEIHSDLMLFGHRHSPAAIGNDGFERNTILCYAPSKTFNIAGLRGSCAVIVNAETRQRFSYQLRCNDSVQESLFSIPAYVTAYTMCDDYLEQMLPYLEGNIRYLDAYLKEHMARIRLVRPEATYLMWLDCAGLGLEKEALYDFIINRCLVGVSRGDGFGAEGGSFVRMNIACPRITLERALNQMRNEYEKCFREVDE